MRLPSQLTRLGIESLEDRTVPTHLVHTHVVAPIAAPAPVLAPVSFVTAPTTTATPDTPPATPAWVDNYSANWNGTDGVPPQVDADGNVTPVEFW